jgi:hypothetical protein
MMGEVRPGGADGFRQGSSPPEALNLGRWIRGDVSNGSGPAGQTLQMQRSI